MQKLRKNERDLGKLIIVKGFKKLPKVQIIAQSGHTAVSGFVCAYRPSSFAGSGLNPMHAMHCDFFDRYHYLPSFIFCGPRFESHARNVHMLSRDLFDRYHYLPTYNSFEFVIEMWKLKIKEIWPR